jgi:hypothetical protein
VKKKRKKKGKGNREAHLLHSVNVGFVSGESLHASAGPNIPDLGCGVTGTRNEQTLIWGYR